MARVSLPMIGTFEGTVVGVAPASIHGDVYFDVLVFPNPPGTGLPENEDELRAGSAHARLPAHVCSGLGPDRAPRPGMRLRLTMLMGQVSGAARV